MLLGVVAVVLSGAAGARSNPPALRVSDVTAEATGPSGADATYTVKAFDPGTGTPLAATCDTPSGTAGTGSFDVTAHFPVGATPVSCETTTLDATTVTGNGGGNTLIGGPGLDLFYGNMALDTIVNWDPATETFVSV